jgi:hypothetical protein
MNKTKDQLAGEVGRLRKQLRGLIAVAEDAYQFVVCAVLENVTIEGFDPNGHMLAVDIRKALKECGVEVRQTELRGKAGGIANYEEDDF